MVTMSSYTSYLGKRGHAILKSSLSIQEQKFIRDELTVRPYIPKSPAQPPKFPIYRESPNKLYLPRYFALDHFGPPTTSKLTDYERRPMNFAGSLRDYQQVIVDKYMNHVSKPNVGGGLLEVPCGRGKTCCALYIAAQLSVKTLVIVHKEFLLNQWVERIQQFIPQAKIGRLQGQVLDIEDKDIVIAMLQSLSMKEYPDSVFQPFGLTIVDEVHHISSEVFSRALCNVVTEYTLGLSATMQRKDGLSKVFKMFLGEIAYREKAKTNDTVLVRGISYDVEDPVFNEVQIDYRGNPKYSTMISTLCNYHRRSDFIMKVLKNELTEEPNQQIMILAHQKAILTYLYDAIEHTALASVGYYVGGMKEAELKKSESKTIILATYAMASEGLDIKSLTTLLMATPKTDITQSVGRILRVAHKRPLIIDIIDSHEPFQRQWQKRRKFYNQNKYAIQHINSNKYGIDEWEDISVNSKQSQKSSQQSQDVSGCVIDLSSLTFT